VRTNTMNFKAELPFGAVAAACPPPAWLRPNRVQEQAPAREQSAKQGGTGVFGLTGESGTFQYAGTANIAGLSGAVDGKSVAITLFRPFHTMSRRDPRTWRPPN
jgi:hypothetical protein